MDSRSQKYPKIENRVGILCTEMERPTPLSTFYSIHRSDNA